MTETTGWTACRWEDTGESSVARNRKARGWLMLCAWVAGVVLFMLVVGPALLQRPALRPMAEVIETRGIEANMYFYTEVEAFYDANVNMDNTWAYPRSGNSTPGLPERREK
jgi:hypothetical protein